MGSSLGRGVPRLGRSCLLAALVSLGLLAPGCGEGGSSGGAKADADPPATSAPTECRSDALAALTEVAQRVYREAVDGRIAEQARLRLQRSRALIGAVQRGDGLAARRILRRLLESQIVRVRVIRAGRVLADVGKHSAIAPLRAPLLDASGRPVAELVLSVIGANGFAQTAHELLGAQVLVLGSRDRLTGTIDVAGTMHTAPPPRSLPPGGALSYHGVHYLLRSFPAQSFSAKPLRVELLAPETSLLNCGATPAQTRANTLGQVGIRIYAGEREGARVAAVVRHVERSRSFRAAVLGDNRAATRAAIIGFFRTHLHVVRVRATLGHRLVLDLGGPDALAPVAGTVRDARGRVRGSFLLALQDDMGYVHLAHDFTGAQVLMRVDERQVMGTLTPGPASIPGRGAVSYEGVNYEAFSFNATAFPSGVLRISLLIPPG